MADDKLQVAIDTVARRAVAIILKDDSVHEEWENYEDVSENDWGQVVYRITQIAKDIDPDPGMFNAAYEYLKGRVTEE